MTYTLNELNALVRLFLFHTREAFTVADMRQKADKEVIGFTRCEIHAEIEANDNANDLG